MRGIKVRLRHFIYWNQLKWWNSDLTEMGSNKQYRSRRIQSTPTPNYKIMSTIFTSTPTVRKTIQGIEYKLKPDH